MTTPTPTAPADGITLPAPLPESPTHGMNLGERIAHVGGRTNAQGYIEFGSVMAVDALIKQVLRDVPATQVEGFQARYRIPDGEWSSWGHVVCGVKGHEQELRIAPDRASPSRAAWIDVAARLPEPGKAVLLDIGRGTPLRAVWAAKHTIQAGDEAPDDWAEYVEADDMYYCPEGWYEWNEHEETHWAVSATPLRWMTIPVPAAVDVGAAQAETAQAAPVVPEALHTFLNAAAGEGLVIGGVDAADLYIAIFPERYAQACATPGATHGN